MIAPMFEKYVTVSSSVLAGHAIIRALADRVALSDPADLESYLRAAVGERSEALQIALEGIRLIEDESKVALSQLPDGVANAYMTWLGAFSLRRRPNAARTDSGKTLLRELRETKVSSSDPSGNQ